MDEARQRLLPSPVFEVAPDGRSALTLNFSRLWDLRPETGYCGSKDPWNDHVAPDQDGIFRMDLGTGTTKLIISHRDMAGFQPVAEMPRDLKRYFTHLLFNEDGSRFLFWYRCASSDGKRPSYRSGLYTASPDGNNICFLSDNNSHSTWLGLDKVLAWASRRDEGSHSYLFTDQTPEFEIIGEGLIDLNGHATFSPDERWILTDQLSADRNECSLILYSRALNHRVDIGRLRSMPELTGPFRCDLHPRWNRNGTQVCVDSTHEGSRQMYLFDVTEIVDDPEYLVNSAQSTPTAPCL